MSYTSKSTSGVIDASARLNQCNHPGCGAEANHRAPKARNRLNDYYWFCMDHIREYNRSWNYCAGMSDGQVESEIRNDTVWRRPTWPFSGGGQGNGFGANVRFRDDLGIFDAADSMHSAENKNEQGTQPRQDGQVERALRIMNIDGPVNLTELKSRYKELVKRLHPDANGGDRAAEERLKDINQAYATIKKFLVA
jgi:hypothetical protein